MGVTLLHRALFILFGASGLPRAVERREPNAWIIAHVARETLAAPPAAGVAGCQLRKGVLTTNG